MIISQHMARNVAESFQRGDLVRLKADPHRQGAIIDGPKQYPTGVEYCVFLDQIAAWYDASQLEPVETSQAPRWVSRDDLIRELTLAKLQKPLTDALYSYRSSRTEFQAYQFRPALKFLRNPHQRILIADEVGLGKTIEAAIIYLELKARLDITRVFVLCPSRLTAKWQEELRNRFD